MNHNVSQTNLLFVDRPMTDTARNRRAAASRSLFRQDETDYSEVALRVFLVICLLASMVVCGLEMSGASQAQPTTSQAILPPAPVCIGTALPAASFVPSLR